MKYSLYNLYIYVKYKICAQLYVMTFVCYTITGLSVRHVRLILLVVFLTLAVIYDHLAVTVLQHSRGASRHGSDV